MSVTIVEASELLAAESTVDCPAIERPAPEQAPTVPVSATVPPTRIAAGISAIECGATACA